MYYVLPTIESHAKKNYAHIIEQAQSDFIHNIFSKSEQRTQKDLSSILVLYLHNINGAMLPDHDKLFFSDQTITFFILHRMTWL